MDFFTLLFSHMKKLLILISCFCFLSVMADENINSLIASSNFSHPYGLLSVVGLLISKKDSQKEKGFKKSFMSEELRNFGRHK